MKRKNLITVSDLSREEIDEIFDLSFKFKKAPLMKRKMLKSRTLALLFQKPSNRTRISFEVAMTHLGGHTMYLSPREIDMGTREPAKDVACVVSRYVDCIAARVRSHDDISILSRYSDVPVINALSDRAHPCQALCDVFTIKEKFGKLKKIKLTYIGDGNNVLHSLLIACAKTGLNLTVATPKGYEPNEEIVEKALEFAKSTKAKIEITNDPVEAVKGAEVVYTDVWVSMGQEEERDKRLSDFSAFQVNETLLKKTGKETLIMHCLPARRGEEVTDVVDGKFSIIYDQAENRMHVEKAILYLLMK